MANSNGWGDGAANNNIGWGQGANNAIGWGDIHADSWAGLTDIVGVTTDPDAQAFITAAAITDPTQQSAINQLVFDLKGYSIWSKMKALYPFVGGTASAHKFNLKDPRDLDVAFRLVFNGGWTHSSTGATPNGTNGYADTKYTPSSHLTDINSNHISFYSRTNALGGIEMGGGPVPLVDLALRYGAGGGTMWNMAANANIPATTDSRYFLINTRTASNLFKYIKNGTTILTTSTGAAGTTKPNVPYYIGKRNYPDGIYSTLQCAFASIGDGLTDTEAANFAITVEKFQTTLGRSVNPWYDNGTLLLDTYSGASVAYSLRKVRNYYIGASIRVRRSSDNAEQDIYFNSTGALDETALTTFVGAGNGFVTTFYDQSGNGKNITQSTAVRQPQIVSSGSVLTLNTKPTIRLSKANNQYWSNNTVNAINNASFNWVGGITGSLTFWSVLHAIGAQGPTDGFAYVPLAYQTANDWAANNSVIWGNGYNTGTTPKAISSGTNLYPLNTQKITLGILGATNSKIYINNSAISQSVTRTSNIGNYTGLYLGANNVATEGLPGDIQEYVLWGTDQNSNASGINSNTNTYWGTY